MRVKYYSVVQKQGFGTLRKYKKNGRKRDAKSHFKSRKIDVWGVLGQIF